MSCDGVHAACEQKPIGKLPIALGCNGCEFTINWPPTGVVTDQRTVLIEKDRGDGGSGFL